MKVIERVYAAFEAEKDWRRILDQALREGEITLEQHHVYEDHFENRDWDRRLIRKVTTSDVVNNSGGLPR